MPDEMPPPVNPYPPPPENELYPNGVTETTEPAVVSVVGCSVIGFAIRGGRMFNLHVRWEDAESWTPVYFYRPSTGFRYTMSPAEGIYYFDVPPGVAEVKFVPAQVLTNDQASVRYRCRV